MQFLFAEQFNSMKIFNDNMSYIISIYKYINIYRKRIHLPLYKVYVIYRLKCISA